VSGTSATPLAVLESGIQPLAFARSNWSLRMDRSSLLMRNPVSVMMRTILVRNRGLWRSMAYCSDQVT
jgi:hypothetical protein